MTAQNKPAIHGHRGGAGKQRPENTLSAIAYGLQQGADGIEVDLCVTADDVIVLRHDLWIGLGRQENGQEKRQGKTPIRSLSLENLARVDERIPTLDECVALIFQHNNTLLNLEMKSQPSKSSWTPEPEHYVSLILEKLESLCFPWQRIFLQSFDWRLMQLAKQQRADLNIGLLTSKKTKDYVGEHADEYSWIHQNGNKRRSAIKTAALPQLVKKNGGNVWSCDYRELTESLLQEAHDLGLAVYVWTVNEERDMERMAKLGVDVITTDYPERCRRVIAGG